MGFKTILMLASTAYAGYRAIKYYHDKEVFEDQVRRVRVILELQSHFYNRLPEPDKEEFERRVVWFIQDKEFISQLRSQPVTEEMKVLIASCAVQLTFGFKPILLEHFFRILIYPDKYRSVITRRFHEGEVNLAGLVVLSWKHFLEGYHAPTSGRNLGLHELAHALYFENTIDNREYNFFKPAYLRQWEQVALQRLACAETARSDFFRRYGLCDRHEFFAVSVEHFFEQPLELKHHMPDVYLALSSLLHQDPAALLEAVEEQVPL